MAMSLLLVDDDLDFLEALRRRFAELCFEVTAVADPLEAVAIMRTIEFDVALVDLGLPGMSGIDVVRCLREHSSATAVVVIAEDSDFDQRFQAVSLGASAYLSKPVSVSEVEAVIGTAFAEREPPTSSSNFAGVRQPPADAANSSAGNESEQVAVVADARQRLAALDPELLHCVAVDLRGETLILTGRVPTYHLKQMVQESLRRLRGVRRLVNRIEVFCDVRLAGSDRDGHIGDEIPEEELPGP